MATILIVDDLPANRQFLTTLLGYSGHTLIEAANGEEALDAARAAHPDLIITDVVMPVMDGYEFVRVLRTDAILRRVPVFFYTAHFGEREARELAHTYGVSLVLTKPTEPDQILAAVERALAADGELQEEEPPAGAATPVREHLRLLTDKLSSNVGALQTANMRLRALVNIGLELASERDSERLLDKVCHTACELFEADYATLGIIGRGVWLVEGGSPATTWIAHSEDPAGLLGDVVAGRSAKSSADLAGGYAAIGLPPAHPPVASFLAVPVASPTRVFGWLCLSRRESGMFTPEDEQLLLALCGQVGRIYENGYFYAIARGRAEQLEHEMHERERVTAQLAAVEQRTRFALEAAGIGISDYDYESDSTTWSHILEGHHGLSAGAFEGTLAAFFNLVHPDDVDAVHATLAAMTPERPDYAMTYRTVWPDGSIRWIQRIGRVFFDAAANPVRRIGVGLDVTALRQLEEQYQQAQKMEAVGRLAGGIAHDFNNLLTAILGYCHLLEDAIEPDDRDKQDSIGEIRKAGERAAGLTRQLLAFSRKQVLQPRVLNVNVVISEMSGMLHRLIGEDVALEFALSPRAARVKADAGQIEQVVMNLVINARDAMRAGGAITIVTDTSRANPVQRDAAASPPPDETYVVIAISDTGVGIDAETRKRLFEPFFTTKPIGEGTGLGLATVFGIVSQSGGHVTVDSQPGRGATFKVYLPEVLEAEDPQPANVRQTTAGGGETVLLVEDEAGVRHLAGTLLRAAGYNVIEASGAAEAWTIASLPDQHIDLVLSDVVMPGHSGPAMFSRISDARPGIKVCYMSGYTDEAIARTGVLPPGVPFLEKPFTPAALRRKIREALDSGNR